MHKSTDSHGKQATDATRARLAKKAAAGQKRSSVNNKLGLSLTITPYGKKGGLEYSDADRLQAVAASAEALYTELQIRKSDGQVVLYTISVERGEENNNPHNQGYYELKDVMVDDATIIKAEKAWIKEQWLASTALPVPRIELRVVRAADALYLIGYCYKDEGLAHFYNVHSGIIADLLARAREFYRSNAGTISWTSKKINKNPKAEEKQLSFKLGNKITLATWFVHHHQLDELSDQLTLPIIIAYAIETTRYRLDDEVMHGRHGTQAICPLRTQAMLQLSFMASKAPQASVTVPLIERVLFGEAQVQPSDNGVQNGPGLLDTPSTRDLATYSLKQAKATSVLLKEQQPPAREQQPDIFKQHPHGGRSLVLDFMSHAKSKEAADMLEGAGLEGHTQFATSQLPSACGYLAAGWVAVLNQLAAMFHTLDFATADALNTTAWVKTANQHLNLDSEEAVWLTGDQVLQLTDAIITGTTPGIGPAPMNFWRATVDRHLEVPEEWGKLHMMVVNSESTYTLFEETTGIVSGVHWFVVAWWLNVAPADGHPARPTPQPERRSPSPPLPWETDD
jgi:hypothetical protein